VVFNLFLKKLSQMDFVTILFVLAAAVTFTWVTNKKNKNAPNLTEGPPDHLSMPETQYIFPMEARELNASVYGSAGNSYQVGAFGMRV
jgi:hypothetical protein